MFIKKSLLFTLIPTCFIIAHAPEALKKEPVKITYSFIRKDQDDGSLVFKQWSHCHNGSALTKEIKDHMLPENLHAVPLGSWDRCKKTLQSNPNAYKNLLIGALKLASPYLIVTQATKITENSFFDCQMEDLYPLIPTACICIPLCLDSILDLLKSGKYIFLNQDYNVTEKPAPQEKKPNLLKRAGKFVWNSIPYNPYSL